MRKPNAKKKKSKKQEGQLTINIFATFFSIVAFLFIQQAGILLINIMFQLNYPYNLARINGILGMTTLATVLIFLFGVAIQAGFTVIRRTKADEFVFILFNAVTLLLLFVQGVGVARAISPFYAAPNALMGLASVFSTYIMIKGVPERFAKHVRRSGRMR